jgi:hypothetical protein
MAASAAAFRLRLGGGVALRLRFAKLFSSLSAPLSPFADRRPKSFKKDLIIFCIEYFNSTH